MRCEAKKLGFKDFLGPHLKMWACLLLRVKCPFKAAVQVFILSNESSVHFSLSLNPSHPAKKQSNALNAEGQHDSHPFPYHSRWQLFESVFWNKSTMGTHSKLSQHIHHIIRLVPPSILHHYHSHRDEMSVVLKHTDCPTTPGPAYRRFATRSTTDPVWWVVDEESVHTVSWNHGPIRNETQFVVILDTPTPSVSFISDHECHRTLPLLATHSISVSLFFRLSL